LFFYSLPASLSSIICIFGNASLNGDMWTIFNALNEDNPASITNFSPDATRLEELMIKTGPASFNACKIVPLLDFDQLAARLRELDNA